MKDFRLGKNDTAHYSSFAELREAWGLKKLSSRTKDEKKLAEQREKFVGTCNVCKQPLVYCTGTNVCYCNNENCKGIKVGTKTGEDGKEKPIYAPYQRILNEKGLEIGLNLFD